MPTPWQNVYVDVWGVLILRVVGLLALAHKNPLVTPLVLRVLGKKNQKKKKKELPPRYGASWRRMDHTKAIRTPFSECSRVPTTMRRLSRLCGHSV